MFLGFLATWSPRPFDDFGGFDPNPPKPIRRTFGLSQAQWLGVCGSVLLGSGVFLPAFGTRWPGQSLLEVSMTLGELPLDALIVFTLAAVSLVLAWHDQCVLLWLTGIGSQIALASSYALWTPPPTCFPYACDPQLGWGVMQVGLLLLLVAGFLGKLPPLRHWKPMPPAIDRFSAAGGASPT
jgi:hypothetical protein